MLTHKQDIKRTEISKRVVLMVFKLSKHRSYIFHNAINTIFLSYPLCLLNNFLLYLVVLFFVLFLLTKANFWRVLQNVSLWLAQITTVK